MIKSILPILCSVLLMYSIIMSNTILQWNCRGLNSNFEELSLLINEYKPVALCLQETFLKDSDKFTLKYHSCYHTASRAGDRVCGGVAVVVNNLQLSPS